MKLKKSIVDILQSKKINSKKFFIAFGILLTIILLITSINFLNKSIINSNLEDLKNCFENQDINSAKMIIEKNKNNNKFINGSKNIIINYCDKYGILYSTSEVEMDTYMETLMIAINLNINSEKYSKISSELKYEEEQKQKLLVSNEAYKNGIEFLENNMYEEAINEFSKVISDDSNYKDAIENITIIKRKLKEDKFSSINQYIDNKEFDLALKDIDNLISIITEDDEITTMKSYINTEKLKYEEKKRIEEAERKKQEEEAAEILRKEQKEKEKYNNAKKLVEDDIIKFYKDMGRTISLSLVDNGEIDINGEKYYSFFTYVDDVFSGDSMQVVNKNNIKHYVYYSNGDLISYEEWSKPIPQAPIPVTIAELNKSIYSYYGQTVEVTGEIVYIKENLHQYDLILINRNGEYVHVEYMKSTRYVKGDVVTAKGFVIGTTTNYTWFGNAIEIPSLTLGEIY